MKFFTPNFFLNCYKPTLIILALSFFPTLGYGLYQALIISPIDYQHGELVRIMYVHVPAAWLAIGIYTFMALCSLANLIWANRFAYIIAGAAAPIGASFALITLITGSIWGYPAWGTWWVWDARLTSMLILFLFYLSYIIIFNNAPQRAEKPCSVVSLLGFVNIPIVKFSVNIWASLHQGSSVLTFEGPKIHASMLKPLFLMFAAFGILFWILLILRIYCLMAEFKYYNRNY
jgi:heme exporter protein C